MAHTNVFNIQELLEQILFFLAIDKSLYPTLFVCRHWYRCGAPILWKRIKLKGKGTKNRPRLERFIKIVRERHKPVYSSSITHLKISYYHSLSDKKIKDIVSSCPNIIHLNFKRSTGFSDKALILIAGAYPNLKYLNLCDYVDAYGTLYQRFTNKGLLAISSSYHKLEYLNIYLHTGITELDRKSTRLNSSHVSE